MLGKMVENKLIERKLSRTEFAKRINRSRSYVYAILERDSIETADLLVISKVLGYNFFAHLNGKLRNLPPFQEEPTNESMASESPLDEKLSFLEKENENLQKIVKLLEEKISNQK